MFTENVYYSGGKKLDISVNIDALSLMINTVLPAGNEGQISPLMNAGALFLW